MKFQLAKLSSRAMGKGLSATNILSCLFPCYYHSIVLSYIEPSKCNHRIAVHELNVLITFKNQHRYEYFSHCLIYFVFTTKRRHPWDLFYFPISVIHLGLYCPQNLGNCHFLLFHINGSILRTNKIQHTIRTPGLFAQFARSHVFMHMTYLNLRARAQKSRADVRKAHSNRSRLLARMRKDRRRGFAILFDSLLFYPDSDFLRIRIAPCQYVNRQVFGLWFYGFTFFAFLAIFSPVKICF